MNGIQIESINSGSGASATCEEINGNFFSQGVPRRSDKAMVSGRLAA